MLESGIDAPALLVIGSILWLGLFGAAIPSTSPRLPKWKLERARSTQPAGNSQSPIGSRADEAAASQGTDAYSGRS